MTDKLKQLQAMVELKGLLLIDGPWEGVYSLGPEDGGEGPVSMGTVEALIKVLEETT
jgi:hypothetical protein